MCQLKCISRFHWLCIDLIPIYVSYISTLNLIFMVKQAKITVQYESHDRAASLPASPAAPVLPRQKFKYIS